MKLMKRIEKRKTAQQMAAILLSLVLMFGLLPVAMPSAQAAGQMEEYLSKLVSWGVMRGDVTGNLHPNRNITRAEFVTLVNRAYGYDKMGENPFRDVPDGAWYAEDIRIGYHTGYFAGTSKTTASPRDNLTREQAAVLLGRNMMLQSGVGEVMQFTDGRKIGEWSRGMVQAIAEAGVVGGYADGSFRPQNKITRGEVGIMLVRAIGTPIQKPGTYTLGSVYGNVTITSSGVTLRNTVISGDLYLTGGIGLGDVLLENVTVLGKIVASGAGESNKGDSSIILRNVTAGEMTVDSLANQFVTIRAEGDTDVGTTSVRTPSYIEDVTGSGRGLKLIELDGEAGTTLQLAGNVKEVIDFTPDSKLVFAQGTAAKITVDEKATNSTLTIESGANVKEVNLDVAATVSGKGDIDHLNVNAPGSTVSMLPDTITIRPGVTANINGAVMDTGTAAESSMDPKLLAGYPTARNVAPTSAEAVFSTNKKGTVYWAVTALADGSVGEKDLIFTPAYSAKILKSGNLSVATSKTEVSAKIPGLVTDGSYYLSAVMVDARGEHSPVKVSAFTTPDNSVPKFANGYPYMSKITRDSGQVAVMSSKSCQLFWALLPKGGTAPTVRDFKAGAVSGNLGYGSMDVEKNVVSVFTVNSQTLRELETYDLYLCLIDADGGKDSGVKKLTFTTVDGTPPVFLTEPTVNSIKETSVGLVAALNEASTIYWAVVKEGEEYPKPQAGQTGKPSLDSAAAKLQVASGMNALKSGKVTANANKDVTINVSGLQSETAYDLYYLAQDKAGNYSNTVKMITIHTLDTVAPTISQVFTKTGDAAGKEPLPDTDIKIVFSESVQDKGGEIFLELFQEANDAAKKQRLTELLRKDLQLWDASTYPHTQVPEKTGSTAGGAWINYNEVEISMEEGKTVFLFKNGEALNLGSGSTYYFQIADVADTSNNKNLIRPNPQKLEEFTSQFAEVNLVNKGVAVAPLKTDGITPARVDMSFQMHPVSTASVDDSIYYDVFLWSDSIIKFDLYARVLDETGAVKTGTDAMLAAAGTPDTNGWVFIDNLSLTPDTTGTESVGTSVHRAIAPNASFPKLNSMTEGWTYEYAVSLTQVGTLTTPETWSDRVTMGVTIPAGPESNLNNLATLVNEQTWGEYLGWGLTKGGVKAIGDPEDFEVFKQFTDTQVPQFSTVYPTFTPGDAFVTMHLQIDRPGTVYYAIAPMQKVGGDYQPALETKDVDGNSVEPFGKNAPPEAGPVGDNHLKLSTPVNLDIYQPNFSTSRIKSGQQSLRTGIADVRVEGLEAETTYYAYFVLKGNSQSLSDVYCFQFTTENVKTPAVVLDENSPRVNVTTNTPAEINWILYANDSLFPMLKHSFRSYIKDGMVDTYTANWATYFPDIAADTNNPSAPTVLDALLSSMPGDGKSVFDEFANNTAYNEVLARIQGQTTGTVEFAGRGQATLKENTPVAIDCTKYMTPETQYYFLAAARNAQGSIYGFKAVGNVHIPDSNPPEFKTVQTVLTGLAAQIGTTSYTVPSSVWTQAPRNYAYKGTVTIEFDEPVYQLVVESGNKKTLVELTKNNLVSTLATSGGTLKLSTNTVGSVITLNFEGATEGASIYFFRNGTISDAYSNAHPMGQRLKLTFDTQRTTKDDDPKVVLPVANPGWKATWG